MIMAWIWTGMVLLSLVFGLALNNLETIAAAAMTGAGEAVSTCISIGGMICLWSGIMEVMRRSGLTNGLSRLLRPVLARLYPSARADGEAMRALSSNMAANLMGLGNAATPAGIRAAERLYQLQSSSGAGPELCMLVVMNTASIQLLPTTIAGVRAANGAAAPFDILPAVWISSAASVLVGILVAKLLERVWRKA